jgi:hypothetical protein
MASLIANKKARAIWLAVPKRSDNSGMEIFDSQAGKFVFVVHDKECAFFTVRTIQRRIC